MVRFFFDIAGRLYRHAQQKIFVVAQFIALDYPVKPSLGRDQPRP
jgi:hypothetical protein